MLSIPVAAFCALFAAAAGQASAAPPTFSHLFPAGGQRGTKVAVTCSGQFNWPVKVFAPGVDVTVGSDSGKLEISIPADLPADRVWIRLHNADGASANVPFLIGQLGEVNEQEPNNTPRNAQALPEPNVTVNGVLAANDVDGFAVKLQAGQTLVAALDAHTRLGSPMDAMLQVATPDGTVVAENNDAVGLDPRLAYTAPTAGTYVVRLFAFAASPDTTIAFRGGDNYIYRLTLTTGSFITHAVPLAAPLANSGPVELAGWNLAAGTKLAAVPFGGERLAAQQEFEPIEEFRRHPEARLGFVFGPGLAGSARVRLSPLAAPAAVAEPTDPNNPAALPLSSAVTGWLKKPGQKDFYRLPLKKGEQVIVSVESRGLDLALDPVLRLADPTGAVVAEVDDTGASPDVVLAHTAAHDGDYRVTVADRFDQAGPRCLYLLTARPELPDFELLLSADLLTVPADKPAELPVKILRRSSSAGSMGPITIEAQGLPAGLTVPPLVSEPTGATAGEIKLQFPVGAAFSGPIRIVGKATQPTEKQRTARTPAKLGICHDTLWLTVVAKP